MLLAVCQHTPAQPVWPPAVDDRPELGATPIDYLPALAGDYFKHESLVVGRRYHIFVRLPEVRTNNHMILASGSRDRDYLRGAALEWRDEMAGRDDLPWQATFLDIEGGTHAASLPDVYRRAMLIYSNLKASHQRIRAAVDIAASPIQITITTAPAMRDTGRAATKFAFIRNSARCSLSSTFSTNHTPSGTIRKSSTNPRTGMKSGIKSTGLKA